MAALAKKLQTITTMEALDGAQRSAVLLMYLDREVAKTVLEHMSTEELRETGLAMAEVEQVEPTVIEQVIASFVVDLHQAAMVPATGQQFALKVYPGLLPKEERHRVEGNLRRNLSSEFQDFLATRPGPTIAAVLADEHLQTQAVAMLLMGKDNASKVLKQYDEADRTQLVLRMAKIHSIPGDLVDDVERLMTIALADQGDDLWLVPGLERTAKIIGQLDREKQEDLLEKIYEDEPDLSDLLRKRMLVFSDLLSMPDRSIQTILKNVEREALVVALRGAEPAVRALFLKNMSSRASQDMAEEIELLGPVPRSSVEKAQEEIVETVMRLAEDGVVNMPTGGDDGEMV